MTVFVIRNYISVITAECIIRQYKISSPYALIVDRSDVPGYADKIRKNLNKELWTNIDNISMYYLSDNAYNKLREILEIKRIWKQQKKEVLKKLTKINKIDSIFITYPAENLEKIMYWYGKKHKIPLSSFEEGLSHYDSYCDKLRKKDACLKRVIRQIVYFDCKFSLKSPDDLNFSDVYCLLPNCYTRKNYTKSLFPIKPDFNNKELKEKLISFPYDVLLIAGPFVEQKVLTELEEYNLLKSMVDFFKGKRIVLKPHPRENKEKVIKYADLLHIDLLDENLSGYAAESIVENSNINYIGGVLSSTLVYESLLNDKVIVYSFYRSLKDKNLIFKTSYEDMCSLSNKIIFI